MFSVDFETLQQIIQQLLYTGVFRAQISAPRHFPEDGYIELQVREGTIYRCYFVSARGKTYKLDRWDAQLATLGVLDWKLVQEQLSPVLPSASLTFSLPDGDQSIRPVQKYPSEAIPYHVVVLSPAQLREWPTLHRQVYSLIDGKHHSSEIAQILHKSSEEIERTILDLRQRGFIQVR